MKRIGAVSLVRELMMDFAGLTGLTAGGTAPRRYLWTDAFALCNYLELFRQTQDETWRELAQRLVDEVHHVLGRQRGDDRRTGWISGLGEEEGERHPTAGGLRIGKPMNERNPGEPADELLEWDRDGQYYHYLTKWMHALNRASRVTGDPTYAGWAMELAQTAHARFTYVPYMGGRKMMYWKMSIDLSRPIVPSMGQHDPLDGLITYSELQATATGDSGQSSRPGLSAEIAELAAICRGRSWATADPLGIGGLLADAWRMAQLSVRGGFASAELLDSTVNAALEGLVRFTESNQLMLPAAYRLAFRELGLSIGLKGSGKLREWLAANPDVFGRNSPLRKRVEALMEYLPLSETIERFWMDGANREAESWREHREINMVMLATSLAPEGFLTV
jgi:hypothetical protein